MTSDQPTITLYVYFGSPFANKVAAVLKYKGLAFRTATFRRSIRHPELALRG
jgi:glutathione S-transferase